MSEPSIHEKKSGGGLLDDQVTPRSLYGLVILGVLLGVYVIVQMSGFVSTLRAKAETLGSDLSIMEDMEAQTVWRDRMRETQDMREAWGEQVWQAASPGIAAAQIDAELKQVAEAASVDNLRIDVSAATTLKDGVTYIRFELSGAVAPEQIPRLFTTVATSRKLLVLDDVRLTTRKESNTIVQMNGIAPFQQVAAPSK